MNTVARHTSIVSAVALLAVGSAGWANAQSKTYGGQNNFCIENPDQCGPQMNKPKSDEQTYSKKRRVQQEDKIIVDQSDQPTAKHAQGDWKFDPNRHKRSRHKDSVFRFYFGGFYYPQPYWSGYGLAVPYHIGCAEGRAIVRDRGFYRVRTVECRGRTFTYLGRRHGDTFRVIVSARTGRIVDVDPV